ncbi:TRAP transporter TatT component family protein [Methylomonas sp. MgM2]
MKSVKLASTTKRSGPQALLLLCMLSSLNACGYFVRSATEDFSDRLKTAVLNHNDPETVAEALPAYLLMQEASIIDDDNEWRLLSTADLYGAYIGLLPDEQTRKQRLSQRSLDIASKGVCLYRSNWCDVQQKTFDEVKAMLQQTDHDDIDALFSLGTAWAGWIQANKSDWNAIAQLAQVKLIMQRILELDESYKQGSAHVYMAVMESLLPASLGGKPDLARQHFQRAIDLAPDNLMTRVLYAKHYARMVFDRELHDNLLKTALNSKATAPDLTLINTLAQQQAQQLLDSANDYF